MSISAGLHRLVLTAHITTSIGWLGAVLAYLALDIVATASQNISAVRAAFFGMDAIIVYVITPLALASMVIGILNALTSSLGLFRHYWVLAKLLLTLFATVILLLEVQNISYMAELAKVAADPRVLPGSLPHSIGGFVVLLIIVVLSVYKPRGITRYGWSQLRERGRGRVS